MLQGKEITRLNQVYNKLLANAGCTLVGKQLKSTPVAAATAYLRLVNFMFAHKGSIQAVCCGQAP